MSALKLLFCTTNSQKFAKGSSICTEYGIELIQNKLGVDEVQSEEATYVARAKAETTFAQLGQPVIISDDSWEIHGLNGFPGTYAKSINTWLTADDLIRLTRDLDDRSATFRQMLVYQDGSRQKLFVRETPGILLSSARGSSGVAIQQIISLEPDGQKSISEMITGTHYTGSATLEVWHDFAKWYTESNT